MQDSSFIAIVVLLAAAALLALLAFVAVIVIGGGFVYWRGRGSDAEDEPVRPPPSRAPAAGPPSKTPSKTPSKIPSAAPSAAAGPSPFDSIPPPAPQGRTQPIAPPPLPSNLRSTVSPAVPAARKPGLLGFFDEPASEPGHIGGSGEVAKTELFQRGKAPPSWLAEEDGEDEGEATEIFSAHHLDGEEGFASLDEDPVHRRQK